MAREVSAADDSGTLRLDRLGGHNRQGSLLSCGRTVRIPQALTDLSQWQLSRAQLMACLAVGHLSVDAR